MQRRAKRVDELNSSAAAAAAAMEVDAGSSTSVTSGSDREVEERSALTSKYPKLQWLLALVLTLLPYMGTAISQITKATPKDKWYDKLSKPSVTPEGYIIGIVWSVLFPIIGLASFLVWRVGRHTRAGKTALILYTAQLVLNWAWQPLFFSAKEILASCILLWLIFVLVCVTAVAFYRVYKPAAVLLLPYLGWLVFAGYLATSIYVLNKDEATVLGGTQWLVLLAFIVFPNLGGIVGATVMKPDTREWYNSLRRPSWSPPPWLFAPVWTTLYCTMGIASYMVYHAACDSSGDKIAALTVYVLQLLVNWAFTPLYFGLRNLLLGLIDQYVLEALLLVTLVLFLRVDVVAGVLLVPYLLWGTYALVLSQVIHNYNKHRSATIG